MKLEKIANEIKQSLTATGKLMRLKNKVAQFLEENPYSAEIAQKAQMFLEKNKQLLLLNSGLSGLTTYVDPAECKISVKSDENGFLVNFQLPELKTSESGKLTESLTQNIYNLLKVSKDFSEYNFIVIVSS